jgi:hypothetical protein
MTLMLATFLPHEVELTVREGLIQFLKKRRVARWL